MKKLIAILCAVLILCSLAACSVTCNQFVNDGVDLIKANAAGRTAGFTAVFYGDIIHGIASQEKEGADVFREYTKRVIICFIGLAICGLGNFMSVKAGDVGTSAWTSLAIGISSISGISFGSATFLISMGVILVDLLGRGKLGLGTVLNAVFIAAFSDIFLGLLSFIPEASSTFTGMAFTLAGLTLVSFGTVIYMLAALGCGPRDTLMVILGRKLPKLPIGAVRFCLELAVLAVSMMLGAPFGLGTVAVMLLQASIFQLACNICRCEPRSIEHEDLIDTAKKIFSR